MTERPGALSGIGNTPIVRLSSLPGPDAGDVWVKAAEIVADVDGFATDQLNNLGTLDGCRKIGDEILSQIDGEIHGACVYVGVGGTFIGKVPPSVSHANSVRIDRRASPVVPTGPAIVSSPCSVATWGTPIH